MSKTKLAYVAGLAALLVTALVSHLRATPYNNYVLLAQAFLHGHAWIDWPGEYIDALGYAGQHYVIEAPLPAILLVPYVALFGLHANQTFLSIVLAGVAVGAAWELGERFGVCASSNAWICAFLLAGTDLLWCAMLGDVWFVAHVAAVCFTMLVLVELAGRRRGWVVALWAACAFESRFSMIGAIPVYAYLLVAPGLCSGTQSCHPESFDSAQDRLRAAGAQSKDEGTAAKGAALVSFAGVLVMVALLWVWYNRARWGTWSDIGYT
ncbi:MAG: hypothetical protein JOZ01_05475, partial [Candidatus Eremiobacteraeota bacterium]|nr:hypothetical protein [Candidatus Eremiobacteraeota bacterium]